MMRSLILVAASVLILSTLVLPEAAACEVDDPTGLTTTCVDEYGDASACNSPGYGYTHVGSTVPDVASIDAWGGGGCYQGDGWATHWQYAAVHIASGNDHVRVQYSEGSQWNGPYSFGWCSAWVQSNTPVFGPAGYATACPYGILPQAPWGNAVPNP